MSAKETARVYSLMRVSPGSESALGLGACTLTLPLGQLGSRYWSSSYRERKYSDGEQERGTEREK